MVIMLIDPTKAFEALAHDVRLAVIRLLIPIGAEGLAAGVIGDRIGVAPTALSFHLGRLTNAGLLCARRAGRNQYYAMDYPRLAALVGFLVDDCCAGAPEGCMSGCPVAPVAPEVTDASPMGRVARPSAEKAKGAKHAGS